MAALTIGQVARRAGVHVETIRYYQRLGLLPLPEKPVHGFRRYGEETIRRLRFIKQAQGLGFTLKEIRELLTLDQADCSEVRRLAEQKLRQVESKIRELERLRAGLAEAVAVCRSDPGARCRLLESLLGKIDPC